MGDRAESGINSLNKTMFLCLGATTKALLGRWGLREWDTSALCLPLRALAAILGQQENPHCQSCTSCQWRPPETAVEGPTSIVISPSPFPSSTCNSSPIKLSNFKSPLIFHVSKHSSSCAPYIHHLLGEGEPLRNKPGIQEPKGEIMERIHPLTVPLSKGQLTISSAFSLQVGTACFHRATLFMCVCKPLDSISYWNQ